MWNGLWCVIMEKTAFEVIHTLAGRTLATAESCTGGGIGAALTAVPGSSAVYLGGIISYTNQVKERLLHVDGALLARQGAVSAPVAQAMAEGARAALGADCAVSVTGLAGPGGDDFGNPVGTVFLGYADGNGAITREFHFSGSREEVRRQAVAAALALVLEQITE